MDGKAQWSEILQTVRDEKKKEKEVIAQTLRLDSFVRKVPLSTIGRPEDRSGKINKSTFVNYISNNSEFEPLPTTAEQ